MVRTAVAAMLPASVADAMLRHLTIDGELALAHFARADRRRLSRALVEWPLPVVDSRGYNFAEATAGGVALAEIDPATMESRVCPGLYCVGEILDVDGRIGGFNFQWAWSSAFVAARALARRTAERTVIALVGVCQPRLFISRSVIAALNDEELAASVAHEVGHRQALDNFKRLMFLSAPDFLPAALARVLEQRWASAAELNADRRASDGARDESAALGARCALASAIVKVARMMPVPAAMAEPISTLVDGGDIESRVHSLLASGARNDRPDARTTPDFARPRDDVDARRCLRAAMRRCCGPCTRSPRCSCRRCPLTASASTRSRGPSNF